jgi:hypothetical protein
MVTAAGRTWTIQQSAAACVVTGDMSKVGTVPANGQAYTIPMTATGPMCSAITFGSLTPWIEVSSVEPTLGRFILTAYTNFGTVGRSGSFQVGDKTFTISQTGSTLPENTRFLQLAYFGCLGRLPSQAEIDSWAPVFATGASRTDIIARFFSSTEFNVLSRFVAGLYVGILNRDAEYNGWRYQRRALRDAIVDPFSIVENFINSAEYKLKYGTVSQAEFVRLLYRYVLRREASQSEVDFQIAHMKGDTLQDRRILATTLLNSEEFRQGTGSRLMAFLLYAAILARDSAAEERQFQAAAIDRGVPISVMINSFVNSPEFNLILK